MEATLRYQLPEDQGEFDRATRARDLYLALTEITGRVRDMVENSGSDTVSLERVRGMIATVLDERGIHLDQLDG